MSEIQSMMAKTANDITKELTQLHRKEMEKQQVNMQELQTEFDNLQQVNTQMKETQSQEADRILEENSRLALKATRTQKERSTEFPKKILDDSKTSVPRAPQRTPTRISEENSKEGSITTGTSTARTKEENIRHIIRQTNMSKPVKTKRQLSRGSPFHDDRDGDEKPTKTGPAPVQITMDEIQAILANAARNITKDLKQQHEEETKQHQNEMKEQQDAMKNLQNKSRGQQQEMQQQKVAIHNLQTQNKVFPAIISPGLRYSNSVFDMLKGPHLCGLPVYMTYSNGNS
jgi:hypothetical protein